MSTSSHASFHVTDVDWIDDDTVRVTAVAGQAAQADIDMEKDTVVFQSSPIVVDMPSKAEVAVGDVLKITIA